MVLRYFGNAESKILHLVSHIGFLCGGISQVTLRIFSEIN